MWDVCSDQEACELIRNVYDPQEASKILVDHALSRFSSDNLSCMVVRLDFTAKFEKLNKNADGQSISESIPESIQPETLAEKTAESSVVEKTIPVLPAESPEVPELKMPEPEKIHQKENTEPVPADGAQDVVNHMKEDVKAEEAKQEKPKPEVKQTEVKQEKPKESDSKSEAQKKD